MFSERKKGFSQMELLTIVVIVAIIMGIIVSVVNMGITRANTAASLSNLRQIGLALNLYANEHNDIYPLGYNYYGDATWASAIKEYINADIEYDIENIFISPNAELPLEGGTGRILLTYSAHDTIFETIGENNIAPNRIKRQNLPNQSELILIADGSQVPTAPFNNQAPATFKYPTGYVAGKTSDGLLDKFIGTAIDEDTERGKFWLRYRNNGHINVLMVDGHVESIKKGKVKGRNLIAIDK